MSASLALVKDDQIASLLEQRDAAIASLPEGDDLELERVEAWLLGQDPEGARMAEVLRDSLDRIYDGQRTGHYRLSQKMKTEKTHVGTVVEVQLAREFRLDARAEDPTDYRISDVLVDCKYSMREYGWMIPVEAWGHVVLLLWADDDQSLWSGGLWRVDPRHLGSGNNRDLKRTIRKEHRGEIKWLWRRTELPENTLLHLEEGLVAEILGARSGQQRVNTLFRLVQRRLIRREAVLTAARQLDGPRRARMSRERKHLGNEGIIVLGHYAWDVLVAEKLGLPIPRSGQWISTTVVPADADDPEPTFEADEHLWRQVRVGEEVVVPAPLIPRSSPLDEETALLPSITIDTMAGLHRRRRLNPRGQA